MTRQKIVIIGAGFAGLRVARGLVKHDVEIVLIDRNNYHTFKPLLYQVATCGLDPSSVAYPIRSIFRNHQNMRFLLGQVTHIDTADHVVEIDMFNGEPRYETYDVLVIAAGSVTNYFGDDRLQQQSFGLNDLEDAVRIRHHILRLFERATWEQNEATREALMTLVVVGGGPTGLETAGALYELYNNVIDAEFDKDDTLSARVILLEATDRLLAPYPEKLQRSAVDQLRSIGVEVRLNARVDHIDDDVLYLADGSTIPTKTVVWSTGVKGAPIAEQLGIDLERSGRIPVEQTLKVQGVSDVYAAGDIVYLINPQSQQPYPGMIPVANQQGELIAENIINELEGRELKPFVYFDKGIMATIGRSRAVAWVFNRIQLSGFLAWIAWLFLHLIVLMGFRNRIQVFLNWVWQYVFYDRSVRLILNTDEHHSTEKQPV